MKLKFIKLVNEYCGEGRFPEDKLRNEIWINPEAVSIIVPKVVYLEEYNRWQATWCAFQLIGSDYWYHVKMSPTTFRQWLEI